jgi:hypothetical protein
MEGIKNRWASHCVVFNNFVLLPPSKPKYLPRLPTLELPQPLFLIGETKFHTRTKRQATNNLNNSDQVVSGAAAPSQI